MRRNYSSVNILGVDVMKVTQEQAIREIKFAVKKGSGLTYGAVDPHKLNMAYSNKEFRDLYEHFDIVVPDATGTLLAAKLLGNNLAGERLSGDIVAPRIYDLAKRINIKFYLLGGRKEILEAAKNTLKKEFEWLEIAGGHHGYFANSGPENRDIVKEIKKKDIDVVLVGMGSPKQEKWIVDNVAKLPGTVLITMGGYFDLIADGAKPYPEWAYKFKLNWLYRSLQEPARLAPRYSLGLPKFFARIISQRVTQN